MAEEMETLTRYMVQAREAALPPEVAVKGKHHILDTIAAMVSGAVLEPGRMAIAFAQSQGGNEEAQVLSTPFLTTAVTAAMANGFLAHADETDDSHAPSGTHPGCGIVPAALAMGERNAVSGRRLLNAVVLGYDMCARVMHSLGERYTLEAERGFSSHSLGGLFGAASAAGACTEKGEDQMRYLISYTAQQTSGIPTWARDTDHIEKAFDFAGMPARNGVTAAVLVDLGFTGVWDVFVGERNFFRSFSPSPSPEEIVAELGERYEVMRTNIKKHCVGSPIQAAADALGHILDEHPLRPDEVEHIKVTMGVGGARTVNNREMPNICLQHMMAVYLVGQRHLLRGGARLRALCGPGHAGDSGEGGAGGRRRAGHAGEPAAGRRGVDDDGRRNVPRPRSRSARHDGEPHDLGGSRGEGTGPAGAGAGRGEGGQAHRGGARPGVARRRAGAAGVAVGVAGV